MSDAPNNGKVDKRKGKFPGRGGVHTHHKLRHKATMRVVNERVEYVAHLLVQEKTRCEIHRIVRRKFDIEWQTCDSLYINRAREWLKERCSLTAAQAKNKGLNVLLEILRSGELNHKLKVEKRLAEIYGYDAPRRMEVTGKDGEPLVAERPFKSVPTEELIKLAYEDCRTPALEGGNGNGDGHN